MRPGPLLEVQVPGPLPPEYGSLQSLLPPGPALNATALSPARYFDTSGLPRDMPLQTERTCPGLDALLPPGKKLRRCPALGLRVRAIRRRVPPIRERRSRRPVAVRVQPAGSGNARDKARDPAVMRTTSPALMSIP